MIAASRVTSHVAHPTADGFAAELADFIWYNELPVGSSSQYAQYCVFRLAKEQGITVLLDGQGADELLGGYEQYFRFYVQALTERGETARLERELPLIRARYPLALTPPAHGWRERLPFGLRRWLSHRLGIGTNLLYGLKPAVARRVAAENQRGRVARFDALTSALYQDSFGMYLTTLLRYGDRNSMAHSREVRLPFCDHRLAELATEIVKARAQKPVVAVANSLAASAAYWIGCSAGEFYVTPGGEVGSIGVWQAHFDYSKALEEEGVKPTLISAGKFKVEGNPYVPLDPEAQAFMQSRVDDYYNAFIKAVAKGRGVSVADVRDGMGEGRVLGADAALAAKMVDGIATFDDVLAKMQKSAVPQKPPGASRLGRARAALALT